MPRPMTANRRHSKRTGPVSPPRAAAFAALVLTAVTSLAWAQATAADQTELVWCLDEKRSIVRQVPRWRCEGRIVDAEEAERVKDARAERIRRRLARDAKPVVPGKKLRGTGTGFFVSARGEVLTNHHVIDGCETVTVTPANGEEHVAKLRGSAPQVDLALLETRLSTPDAALFRDFDEVVANEVVTVVGYPLHGKVVIKPVAANGHVYETERLRSPLVFAMKIDIRRGNSGGPILDEAGRVIGVVVAKVDTPAVYAKTGELVKDVGLGIRLPWVREFLRRGKVDARRTDSDERLDAQPRFDRAREFVAQIRCWR